jgi:DNA-binding MarR family transcriptional regulator
MAPVTQSQVTASPRPAELASRLRFAVMRLSRRLRQHTASEITQSQLSALATVVRDGPLTLRDLAAAERVQPPTITRIIEPLLERGLVERTPDVTDRRVAWVGATREGRALVEQVRRRRDSYLAHRLRTLDPEELAVLARAAELLERLCEDPAP